MLCHRKLPTINIPKIRRGRFKTCPNS